MQCEVWTVPVPRITSVGYIFSPSALKDGFSKNSYIEQHAVRKGNATKHKELLTHQSYNEPFQVPLKANVWQVWHHMGNHLRRGEVGGRGEERGSGRGGGSGSGRGRGGEW